MNLYFRRKGLTHALSNRDSKQLAQILRFLIRYINVERFMKILIEVSDCLIGALFILFVFSNEELHVTITNCEFSDAYCDIIDSYSSEVKKLFGTLHEIVKKEVKATEELLMLQGALEMILASSSINAVPLTDDKLPLEVALNKD